jgi:hypothetical protein
LHTSTTFTMADMLVAMGYDEALAKRAIAQTSGYVQVSVPRPLPHRVYRVCTGSVRATLCECACVSIPFFSCPCKVMQFRAQPGKEDNAGRLSDGDSAVAMSVMKCQGSCVDTVLCLRPTAPTCSSDESMGVEFTSPGRKYGAPDSAFGSEVDLIYIPALRVDPDPL